VKKVFIVGIDGNMGQRYEACLRSLGIDVVGVDFKPTANIKHDDVDGYIIATPTHRHLDDLMTYSQYSKPILCEKPFAKSLEAIEDFARRCRKQLINIRMVNQYEHLIDQTSRGETIYDYFRTGKDGLAWDCINIIGLSHQAPVLENTSPVWYCKINGVTLNLADMDKAYVAMLKSWTHDPRTNWAYALDAHRKVERWLRS
jgi:hypothetical protein